MITTMTTQSGQAVKLSAKLIQAAKARAKAEHRSMASQIEHWATIGQKTEEELRVDRAAKDNPDLSREFIRDLLAARDEADSGKVKPFLFE